MSSLDRVLEGSRWGQFFVKNLCEYSLVSLENDLHQEILQKFFRGLFTDVELAAELGLTERMVRDCANYATGEVTLEKEVQYLLDRLV